MALREHLATLAHYSTLANERLYGVCAALPDEARKRPYAVSFGSIHGTLNHLLLADRIWLARLSGEGVPALLLDTTLYEDFTELQGARVEEDGRLEAFITGVDESFLDSNLTYTNSRGVPFTDPVSLILAHLFNHQTHHRGQLHVMLRQAGVPTLNLDMHRLVKPS